MDLLLIEQNLGVATAVAERQLVMVAGQHLHRDDGDRAPDRPRAPAALPRRHPRRARMSQGRPRPHDGREPMPTVVLVGTLDTKGSEYAYLRDRVREHGVRRRARRRRRPRRAARRAGRRRARRSRARGRRRRGGARRRRRPRRGRRDDGARRGEVVERLHAEGRLDGDRRRSAAPAAPRSPRTRCAGCRSACRS